MDDLRSGLETGSLLSGYGDMRRVDELRANSTLEAMSNRERLGFFEMCLTRDSSQRTGQKGMDVRLEFELDKKPSRPDSLGYVRLQEVNLADLVSIGCRPRVKEELIESLKETPYESVHIYGFPTHSTNPYRRERIPRPRGRLKEHRGH